MASLQEFISLVSSRGLPLANNFNVYISGSGGSSDMFLLANSASIPGISLGTNEMRIYGEIMEMPYMGIYDKTNIKFILDHDMMAKKYFDDWMNQVYNRQGRFLGYRKDYVRDVTIELLNKNQEIIYSVTLHDAYPHNISELPLSYDSNTIVELTVNLIYKYWTNKDDESSVLNMDDVTNPATYDNQEDTLSINGLDLALPEMSFGGNMGQDLFSLGKSVSGNMSLATTVMGNSVPSTGAFSLMMPSGLSTGNTLKTNLGTLTSNLTNLGAGIGSMASSLNDLTAPVRQIANAMGSVGSTLSSIDGVMNAVGLGTPFAGVVRNINAATGPMAILSQANGVPGMINTVGANVSAMGDAFKRMSGSLDTISGNTTRFQNATRNVGSTLNVSGNDISKASSQLNDYQGGP